MATSLNVYYDRIVYLNLLIYLSYIIVKYLVALVLLCIFAKWCQDSTTPIQWIVFLIFGKLLNTEKNFIPAISLDSTKKMSRHGQITILFIVIISFVILAVGTALDLSLFQVSHICTEDLRIDCYPQLIRGANDTGLNISIEEPITSCTYWNREGVSERVTFVCFDKAFNFDFLLVATGGLLALGLYVIKTTTGVLLFLARFCVQTCKFNDKCVFVLRIVFAVLATLAEFIIFIICLVLAVTIGSPDNVNDPPSIMFLTMHAAEILVIFGISATLLWLPWEEYSYAKDKEIASVIPQRTTTLSSLRQQRRRSRELRTNIDHTEKTGTVDYKMHIDPHQEVGAFVTPDNYTDEY